jgi:hypothetical protein
LIDFLLDFRLRDPPQRNRMWTRHKLSLQAHLRYDAGKVHLEHLVFIVVGEMALHVWQALDPQRLSHTSNYADELRSNFSNEIARVRRIEQARQVLLRDTHEDRELLVLLGREVVVSCIWNKFVLGHSNRTPARASDVLPFMAKNSAYCTHLEVTVTPYLTPKLEITKSPWKLRSHSTQPQNRAWWQCAGTRNRASRGAEAWPGWMLAGVASMKVSPPLLVTATPSRSGASRQRRAIGRHAAADRACGWSI